MAVTLRAISMIMWGRLDEKSKRSDCSHRIATSRYWSMAQRARDVTESWARERLYCLECPENRRTLFPANTPASDAFYPSCGAIYEFKARSKPFGHKIVNGTLVERIKSASAPHHVLIEYSWERAIVSHVTAIHEHAFVPSVIERRPRLKADARRTGWVGSNICLHLIPSLVRVRLMHGGTMHPKRAIRDKWRTMLTDSLFAGRQEAGCCTWRGVLNGSLTGSLR